MTKILKQIKEKMQKKKTQKKAKIEDETGKGEEVRLAVDQVEVRVAHAHHPVAVQAQAAPVRVVPHVLAVLPQVVHQVLTAAGAEEEIGKEMKLLKGKRDLQPLNPQKFMLVA